MKKTIYSLLSIVKSSDSRTKKMGKNSIYLMLIQGCSIAISLILVPMTIGYVSSEVYGIWLTLSSIVGWISLLNIGLNSSLRNRFTETVARSDHELAQKYVSTTYAILGLIFGGFLVLFLIVNPFINWASVLNLPEQYQDQLVYAMAVIVAYFCIKFVLSSINIILLADQRPAESSFRGLCEQLTSLLIIFILTKTTQGQLLYLCLGLCASPIFILTIFNVSLFRNRYRIYRPTFSTVDFSLTKDLLVVGVKFFIINIAGIIQYQMANFIIMRNYGGEQVTAYNIAHKYFNVAFLLFNILLTPLWSAVTEAKAKGDFEWIRKTVKKYILIGGLVCIGLAIMLVIANPIYKLWLGDNVVDIPLELSFFMMLFNMTFIMGSIFVNTLNGLGLLNVQTVACIIGPVVFIASCYLLMNHTSLGVVSIIISSIVANFNGWLLAPIQYVKFIKKTQVTV